MACQYPESKVGNGKSEAGRRAFGWRHLPQARLWRERDPSFGPPEGETLADFYDRTIKSQVDRESPFSIWGQVERIERLPLP